MNDNDQCDRLLVDDVKENAVLAKILCNLKVYCDNPKVILPWKKQDGFNSTERDNVETMIASKKGDHIHQRCNKTRTMPLKIYKFAL